MILARAANPCARKEPVGLGTSKAKIGPSEDSFCRVCRPIAQLWDKKTVKNGPLRPICSRRFPSPTGSWLARRAAAALPAGTAQTWHHLSRMQLPMFVDQRHTSGQYDAPAGDMKTLLDATLAATDIVFVAPVYWYSIPAPLKIYLDHWSA